MYNKEKILNNITDETYFIDNYNNDKQKLIEKINNYGIKYDIKINNLFIINIKKYFSNKKINSYSNILLNYKPNKIKNKQDKINKCSINSKTLITNKLSIRNRYNININKKKNSIFANNKNNSLVNVNNKKIKPKSFEHFKLTKKYLNFNILDNSTYNKYKIISSKVIQVFYKYLKNINIKTILQLNSIVISPKIKTKKEINNSSKCIINNLFITKNKIETKLDISKFSINQKKEKNKLKLYNKKYNLNKSFNIKTKKKRLKSNNKSYEYYTIKTIKSIKIKSLKEKYLRKYNLIT